MKKNFRRIALLLGLAFAATTASAVPAVSITETPKIGGGTVYTVINNSASPIAFFAVTNNYAGVTNIQRPDWWGLTVSKQEWDAGVTIFSYNEPQHYIHAIAQTGSTFSSDTLFTINRHSIDPKSVTLLGNYVDLFGNSNPLAYLFYGIWGTGNDILPGETTNEFSISAPPASEYAAWRNDGSLIYASANQGTALPEPGTLILCSLSLLGIFVTRRRFQR